MESRVFILPVALAALLLTAVDARAQDDESADGDSGQVVIEPDLNRREIKPARIDRENFEVGLYGGLLSIEDFGSEVVSGARFAFHITEDFFAEASYGTTEAGQTSFELLSGSVELLTDEEREFTYYNVSVGYNFLPGEVFLGRGRAFNSSFYVIAGAGSTTFAGDDRFTANFGAGFRLAATDWLAIRADVRDHLFDIDLLGTDKTAHNIEMHLGFSIFF